MRRTILIAALLGLMAFAPNARAEGDTAAVFDVRLLGLKMGRMTLAGRIADGAYVVRSEFATTGVGSIARVSFDLAARGGLAQRLFRPISYSERIDTGRRQSSAELRYSGGVPRVVGGTLAAKENLLDPSTQGGTLDPLSALFAALHDRADVALCDVDVVLFDGARRSRLAMTNRSQDGTTVTCSGAYTRLDGFSARELERQTVYPFSVTFAPNGTRMQAQRVTVRSSYGTAELLRR
ncbi:DUF3108 domain-containing protein [Roseovarius sp. LXJ103]|uniref:DUF3108 domain-containing protein n=1 Tax=Roseovarius carneus TaxID=2853164 RepID=UPI000D617D03|nr:DUF3108 domain-containing protein [Roseovarius carneus]MBZ8117115.1 DUF3108 domain-containing protein [Roseovarius carneus]PWE37041.1 hypothetical protein DD563_14455 [Pelagicola sp. LXJ1103]